MQACNVALIDHDPEMADIIEREKTRQFLGLELIASEVCLKYPSVPLAQAHLSSLCSELHLKGSHGMPWVQLDKQVRGGSSWCALLWWK
jgi:glycine/serine hydroxymethyltransferase